MKKVITLICFVSMAFAANAQYEVPNFSFENWSLNGSKMWPDQWGVYDSVAATQQVLFERSSGGSQGNYAIKMYSYDDGTLMAGPMLEMEDSLPFTPEAFALDYIVPTGSTFMATIWVNLYFYDSAYNFLSNRTWSLSENSNTFKNGVLPLGFTGDAPKWYAFDIQFLDNGGQAREWVIIDNVRFLETYTPPQPPTGVSELNNALFSLYPNPANQVLYVKNYSSASHIAKITGIDGKVIKQLDARNASLEFDLAGIPAGVYTIVLYNKEGDVLGRDRFCKID